MVQDDTPCKRRALLIGINYDDTSGTLLGPHNDVLSLKDLLIDSYNYAEHDIVVMLDKPNSGDLLPTKDNILREIKNLVRDARPDDHLLFHFSGHSTQVDCLTDTEVDGKDECMVACDNQNIIDDDLRRFLVDPLPPKCNLVAIIDSCHSQTMLDLPHYKCNRVWSNSHDKTYRASHFDGPRSRAGSRFDRQTLQLPTIGIPLRRRAATDAQPFTQSLTVSLEVDTPSSYRPHLGLDVVYDTPISPVKVRECPSPFDSGCNGFCRTFVPNTAYVLCLSACKDAQITWEDNDGGSMTRAIIHCLKKTPHPSLRDLMLVVSQTLHDSSERLHKDVEWEKSFREYQHEIHTRLDDFQAPQLASHAPLDMDAMLSL